MWSLPRFLRSPDVTRGDGASFFALGVFSGIASSCCAPVLVGVMTLSALAGNPVGGVGLGLAYVFGMVFPLFVMALVWDVAGLRSRPLVAKPVTLRIGPWRIATNTVNLLVAVGFAVMGGFVMYLANTGKMTSGPEIQVATGRALATWLGSLESWLRPVPEPVLGLGLLAVAGVFVRGTLVGRRGSSPAADPPLDVQAAESEPAPTPHCH
jgi:hypothetical protein